MRILQTAHRKIAFNKNECWSTILQLLDTILSKIFVLFYMILQAQDEHLDKQEKSGKEPVIHNPT